MNLVLYIHGKGGNAKESEHYKALFPEFDVLGLNYKSNLPWKTSIEISDAVKTLKQRYDKIILIANSIGAYFAMNAKIEQYIEKAYFISPILNMEKLILDMMSASHVSEAELKEKGIIKTDFGEDLSWEYLLYVRENPIVWSVPTDILYGSNDNLTSIDILNTFANTHSATITVLDGGEHWFHTPEQMDFLDNWIKNTR